MGDTQMSASGIEVNMAVLSYTISMSDRLLMSVAIIPMSDEFGWTLTEKGYILSAFGMGYIATQVGGGYLAKSYGYRNVLCGAVLVWSLATVATPLLLSFTSRSIYVVAVRVLLGLGEGFALPAVYQLFGRLQSHERTQAISKLYAGGAAGHLLSLFLTPLLPWRDAFLYFGTTGLFWVAAFQYLVPPQEDVVDTQRAKPDSPSANGRALIRAWKPVSAIVVAHTCSNSFVWIMNLWLPTFLNQRFGIPKHELYVTALPYVLNMILGPIVGKFIDGYLSKRLAKLTMRRLCSSLALLGQSLGYIILCYVTTARMAIAIIGFTTIMKTFCAGGWEASHHDIAPNEAGTTYGISNTFATIPSIVLGPLVSFLFEHGGTWCTQFELIASLGIFGAVYYYLLVDTNSHIGLAE